MAINNKNLSSDEVTQRMAILRRFRELLKAQRDRFGVYLDTLEKQKNVIEEGNTDSLIRHVELEEKIVKDIFSIQKVIDPLEQLYRNTHKGGTGVLEATVFELSPSEENDGISDFKSALEDLKAEALSRSERNRNLLSKRMVELRTEIKNIRSNPYTNSAFSDTGNQNRVDLQG